MSNLAMNLRLRLAFLNTTWGALAESADLDPGNVRGWVRRASPRSGTLEQLASLLCVPVHELLNPDFNPRAWPVPGEETKETEGEEEDRNELDDRDS